MAICKSCGVEQAGFMSDLCSKCVDAPTMPVSGNTTQAISTKPEEKGLSEGGYTSMIGQAVMWLSAACAAICIFVFGKIEISDGLYDTKTIWSSTLVTAFVAAGLNGVFFGFLLSKVGSVLIRLEKLRIKD